MEMSGAFLKLDLEVEKVHIKLEGRVVEILAMINSELYRQYITVVKCKPDLYAELRKALYCMLQSALKFWQQITSDLVSLGYVLNEYDRCEANMVIGGRQRTVTLHVDNFVLTHEDPKVNEGLIKWFNHKYGN